jgi:hypothetical protein
MAASEISEITLRLAARRTYERGRAKGALVRGAGAAMLAIPGFLICNQTPLAAACLVGFGLVVAAGRLRGEDYEDGSRAGAIAGILPCLLPAAVRAFDPDLCVLLFARGAWICGIGGLAAGVVLGLRGRVAAGLPFWLSAVAALGFAAALGCIPAGAIGFAGLGVGVVAGGAPVLASRKAVV